MASATDFLNIPEIEKQLLPLLRKHNKIEAVLETFELHYQLPNCKAKVHCHFITLDGNKRPRVNDFARFIAHSIVDFSIPRSEVERAKNEAKFSGSFSPLTELNSKAKALFTSLPKSGEGGEVLLSILAEQYLSLPQLFTKMILKTNTEMHVHGSDGIHAGTNPLNGNLILYWGESKLHADAAQAARECFESLAPFLTDTGGSNSTQERDIQLLSDNIDLNDNKLEYALKRYLDPGDIMFNQLEYRGLCLIGFNSSAYPNTANKMDLSQLRTTMKNVFEERKKHMEKRINEEQIESFDMDIFCLPFPDVNEFRKAFRAEVGL